MKCIDCIDKLSAYIDNELDLIEKKEVEKHLQMCEGCREELVLLTHIQEKIKDIDQIHLPEGFHEQLMKKVDEDSKINGIKAKKRSTMGGRRIVGYLSAVAAALLIVWVGNETTNYHVMETPQVAREELKRDEARGEMVKGVEREEVVQKASMPEVTSLDSPPNEQKDLNMQMQETQNAKSMTRESMGEEPIEKIEEIWEIRTNNKKESYEKILYLVEQKGYVMEGMMYEECVISFNTIEEKMAFKISLEESLRIEIDVKEMVDTTLLKIILAN